MLGTSPVNQFYKRKENSMKKEQSILGILFFTLLFGLCFQQNPLNVEAKTRVIHKDITPKEPASSD